MRRPMQQEDYKQHLASEGVWRTTGGVRIPKDRNTGSREFEFTQCSQQIATNGGQCMISESGLAVASLNGAWASVGFHGDIVLGVCWVFLASLGSKMPPEGKKGKTVLELEESVKLNKEELKMI